LDYICSMKTGRIYIGTFTKEDSMRSNRQASREIELQNSTGWVSTHKAHKSAKDYTRKPKHKLSFV
jgi:hypothetical protein